MDDTSTVRPSRVRRVPLHFLQNGNDHVSDEGELLLAAVWQNELELEVELDESDFPSIALTFIHSESVLILAALTEPIDDPDAKDPKSIYQAKLSIYWTEWLAAIYEELESLKAKGVYEDVDSLPPGRRAIDSKWVLHIKRNGEGLISRFKARLVAKGYTQIPQRHHSLGIHAHYPYSRCKFRLGTSSD